MNTKTTIGKNLLTDMSDQEIIQLLTKFETVKEAKTWASEEEWLIELQWPPVQR